MTESTTAETEARPVRNLFDEWLAPFAVAALWVVLAIVPQAFGPLAVELAAALLSPALVWWTLGRRAQAPAALTRALVAAAAATAVLTLSSAFAANPRVSFFGMIGQHAGALMWLLLAAWLAAFAFGATPRDARRVMKVVAVLGAFAAAAALLDRAGLLGQTGRYSAEASGVFENSLSLAQALLLASACAVGWWRVARALPERYVAAGLALVDLGGLVLTRAVGAYAGLAAGGLLVAALSSARLRRPVVRRVVPALAAILAIAAMSAGLALYTGHIGSSAYRSLDALGNGRLSIWDGAVHKIAEHPLLGSGPDQFSSWATWDAPPGGGVRTQGAYDPHDVVLAWLLGGGVIGLAAFAAAVVLLFAAAAPMMENGRGGPALAALAAGVAGFAVATLTSWVNPLAAFTAAALLGCLLSMELPPAGTPTRAATRVAATAAAAVAVVTLLATSSPLVPLEWRWAAGFRGSATAADAVPIDAYARWPDPAFANILVNSHLAALASADTSSAVRLDAEAERLLASVRRQDLRWHVDIAIDAALAARLANERFGRDTWAAFEAAIEDGRAADPASGVWDYIAATQEARGGRTALARAYARRALRAPLPDDARSALLPLAR